MSPADEASQPRYEILMKLAAGGMATVYIGYLRGGLGFRQVVAIKRPHAHLIDDPHFRQTFATEAHLASNIHHANVVDVRDVDVSDQSVDLVMDYVEGASLARLLQLCHAQNIAMPAHVAIRIIVDACAGLHAAHEATDELGVPLGLVHRDVSPQNILVGIDGVSRVTDFGIAKCVFGGGGASTQKGVLKGKLGYMAPEYISLHQLDRRADVFAIGVVLWESLMGRRLFTGNGEAETIRSVMQDDVPPVSHPHPPLAAALNDVLARTVVRDPATRFERASAIGAALEAVARHNSIDLNHRDVSSFVQQVVGTELEERRRELRRRLGARPSVAPGLAPHSTIPEGAPSPGSDAATSVEAAMPSPPLPATVDDLVAPTLAWQDPQSSTTVQIPMHRMNRAWIVVAVLATIAVIAALVFAAVHSLR